MLGPGIFAPASSRRLATGPAAVIDQGYQLQLPDHQAQLSARRITREGGEVSLQVVNKVSGSVARHHPAIRFQVCQAQQGHHTAEGPLPLVHFFKSRGWVQSPQSQSRGSSSPRASLLSAQRGASTSQLGAGISPLALQVCQAQQGHHTAEGPTPLVHLFKVKERVQSPQSQKA